MGAGSSAKLLTSVLPNEMATCAGPPLRVDLAVADVRDLDTAVAAVAQQADSIVGGQVADVKVDPQRHPQRGYARLWLVRDEADIEVVSRTQAMKGRGGR